MFGADGHPHRPPSFLVAASRCRAQLHRTSARRPLVWINTVSKRRAEEEDILLSTAASGALEGAARAGGQTARVGAGGARAGTAGHRRRRAPRARECVRIFLPQHFSSWPMLFGLVISAAWQSNDRGLDLIVASFAGSFIHDPLFAVGRGAGKRAQPVADRRRPAVSEWSPDRRTCRAVLNPVSPCRSNGVSDRSKRCAASS